ncbi:MAG: DUF599 domain-containing protein [Gammaproteobacteria bacterium]
MLPLLDLSALAWFLACWVGYTWFADRRARETLTLMSTMHHYRRLWMREMLRREVRIVDSNIVSTLARSVAFFASTTIFILAGLLAVLGAMDTAMEVIGELRYAVTSTREVWELKLFVLLLVFIYAFFKFTWSMRHFNYLSIMIGAAPDHAASPPWAENFAERAARVSSNATNTFNRGLRAYYFGLAFLSWFLHPVLFIAATALVVAVLYRREFHSRMLRDLGDPTDFSAGGAP